jgi:aquaporin related protein
VLMLAAEKSKDTFLAPIGIGLSLFVAELAGMLLTIHFVHIWASH